MTIFKEIKNKCLDDVALIRNGDHFKNLTNLEKINVIEFVNSLLYRELYEIILELESKVKQ